MHAATRRGLVAGSRLPARFVAGRRQPSQKLRYFRTSTAAAVSVFPWARQPPDQSQNAGQQSETDHRDVTIGASFEPQPHQEGVEASHASDATTADTQAKGGSGDGDKDKQNNYGSAAKRSMRNRRPKEIPPIKIPFEFLSWNVRRHKYDGPLTRGVLHLTGTEEGQGESNGDIAVLNGSEQSVHDQTARTQNEEPTDLDREEILIKLYAQLQEYMLVHRQMVETYGPPGEQAENWENMPDSWSEMPNLATKYDQMVSEFEDIVSKAVSVFPDGELVQRVSEVDSELAQQLETLETELRGAAKEANLEVSAELPKPKPHPDPDAPQYLPQYSLNHSLMSEVLASMSAGLAPSAKDHAEAIANQKSHLKLLCPIDGGIYFLDKVVEEAASHLNADVIRLDPQDLAEIAGDYIQEDSGATSDSLWTLGYDTAQVYHRPANASSAVDEHEAEEGLDEEMEREHPVFTPKFQYMTAIPFAQAPPELQDVIKKFMTQAPQMFPGPSGNKNTSRGSGVIAQASPQNQRNSPGWNELKLAALLDTLLSANSHKREILEVERRRIISSFPSKWVEQAKVLELGKDAMAALASRATRPDPQRTSGEEGTEPSPQSQLSDSGDSLSAFPAPSSRRTIVLLRDFKEMRTTIHGNRLVDKIVDLIQRKRKEGLPITLVGTSSSAELAENMSFNALDHLQQEDANSVFRTLIVTPDTHRGLYYQEERRRLREINGRHIHAMMMRLGGNVVGKDHRHGSRHFASQLHQVLSQTQHGSDLEERFLTFDDVHRIVFTALGQRSLAPGEELLGSDLQAQDIGSALDLIKKSDEAKSKWAEDEHQLQNPVSEADRKNGLSTDALVKKLRKTCNTHEKNLLQGVVDPQSIKTEFSDVHAPPETIEALKTLTTLSLTRPEAFKYGVLAKDKISGLLLYGPPGTGKTLLAKAVAKQSGATMLEVSGSDVYDMYVGEGEKNVRAVFSLAKKLAPCVVFIDEADAIFASRGSGTNRNSHRELINQFLREWDGMNETSAFIMVATNRPFDLDDAALRRLPRRLLVDLPSEKDREAILGIHLRDEILDQSVSLAKLASQTPLYSGSDLKNLAVAAALAAVREETEEASKHTGDDDYQYPEKRVLTPHHFDRAMEEISASVSEDMSSLGAIRKFDEKYGDRRGRRKKAAYGFTSETAAKEDTAKVRT